MSENAHPKHERLLLAVLGGEPDPDPDHAARTAIPGCLAVHLDRSGRKAVELTISVACTDYLQAAIGAPIATLLQQRAPGLRLALYNLDVAQLADQMERGIVDLALMTPACAPPGLRTRHLFNERYVLVGRRGHPALNDTVTIDDFAALQHVIVSLRGGDFDTSVDQALAVLGKSRRVVLSAASFLFVPEMIAQSDFVALVPERLVYNRADRLAIVSPPFPVEDFEVSLTWHERVHNHSGHRWIRELILSHAGDLGDPAG